jgi:hypothetical protein
MSSKDGLDWTDRIVGEEGEQINSMLFDGKQFVGIGQGATYFSKDGTDWKRVPNKNAPTIATFGAGLYVGTLWPGKILCSEDGINWELTHELSHNILTLAFGQLGTK